MTRNMEQSTRSALHIAFSVVGLISFLLVLFFNGSTNSPDLGIFSQPTGNVSDRFNTYITPSGWTFIIWAIIYTWMAVAIIYALSQLCRSSDSGPVYLSPVTVPLQFWVLFITNQALNISWLFVWDRELMTAAAVFLFLIVITNWLAMYILHSRLVQDGVPVELPRPELIALRVTMHNGLAVYTTWTTIAALLNLDIAIVYVAGASNEVASLAIACVLGALIILWLVLELTVLDKYTRWTISPGFTLVWALSGVFDNNYWRAPGAVPAVLGAVLGVACLCLLIRLVVLVVYVVCPPAGRRSGSVDIAGRLNGGFSQ
ncbi:uncharacterized protein LOC122375323 [Amphibalanus amphitrite]|uniref:uncharacterized protein LOC122375323 n=1 Tax=Amphibalanus amphitrite TaxID=1232801 RepID=UPI001C91479A|nr:uncharacterized protein LOC122375323 [Amphibalanus amphitrite]